MIWKFTIMDRDGVMHEIDEPIGWDDMTTEIKRDLDTHGVFFDYQGNDFLFDGLAAEILKAEKTKYGIEGIATLIIKYTCGSVYEELYRGRFLFAKYSFTCSDECFVRIPIEAEGDVMDLKNKWDQPVDMEALKGFDEVSDLQPYDGLGKVVSLPSKAIHIKNEGTSISNNTTKFKGVSDAQTLGQYQLDFGFNGVAVSEIGDFSVSNNFVENDISDSTSPGRFTIPGYEEISVKPLDSNPIVNYNKESPNFGMISNPVKISLKLDLTVHSYNSRITAIQGHMLILPDRDKIDNGEVFEDYTHLTAIPVYLETYPNSRLEPGQSASRSINRSFNVDLVEPARIYFFIRINESKTEARANIVNNNNSEYGYGVEISEGSYFLMENLSKTETTSCKIFLVNEAMSRAAEAITNDKIRVISDYFGRHDSKPYNRTSDGCGSLEAITKGLFIRRQEQRLVGRPPVFSISLKQIFEGLNPIHHIGIGIEKDPYRRGYNCLRVENWKYFYSNDVVHECNNVSKIESSIEEKDYYSMFSFGYEKWESEEYTGLDEFLTKRNFRTTLNGISNTLTKLSKFIASGYAIEITRRKGNADSKDWRYDNDTFIICLERDPSGFRVEQGNILFPENIIDPDTIYNYRISPIRNAMRWFDEVSAGFKQPGKLIFTDGDGNYWARGLYSGKCSIESTAVAENDTITLQKFIDEEEASPILQPERVVFDCDLSASDFKKIKDNPYGLIAYNNDCTTGFGWVESISAKHNEGLATFRLIPKK